MAGIKAGYGVSKKDQLESIVCDHASRKMMRSSVANKSSGSQVRCDEPDTKSEKKDAAR